MNNTINEFKQIARLHHAHMLISHPEFQYSASLEAIAACFNKQNYRALSASVTGQNVPKVAEASWQARALRAEALLREHSIADLPSEPNAPSASGQAVDSEEGGRYVYGEWDHMFDYGTMSTVRFLFDTLEMKLLRVEDVTDRDHILACTGRQARDLYDSLVNANEEALDCPENHGLQSGHDLPPASFWSAKA